MAKKFIDRTGLRYGRLIVLAQAPSPGKTRWTCLCDCGKETIVSGSNLVTSHIKSCGCLLRETAQAKRRYAEEYVAEYRIWRGIKQRTSKSAGKNAEWYAHVQMCPAWQGSFDQFLRDVGKRPSPQHTIERINGDLGYAPKNCIWALPKVQANNRSTNFMIEHAGVTRTLAQWAEHTGIAAATIRARLIRSGWSVEDALSIPVNRR